MVAGCSALGDYDNPRGLPRQPTKIKEALPVCHTLLHNPQLYTLLLQIDEQLAEECRVAACPCGGVLHRARYARKPRGVLVCLPDMDRRRQSFCCADCRRRSTPRSVFYLGRRVYVAVMVLLGAAWRGAASGRALHALCAALRVPRRTLDRWLAWWNRTFPSTRCWQSLRGDFMPPLTGMLPAALLTRLNAQDSLQRLLQVLRLIAPLSTVTEGRR